jgi:hypothetical protein
MSYADLVEDIVAAQGTLLGEGAVTIARGVDGLEMNGEGSVESLNGDGADVVDALVGEYVDDLGQVAQMKAQAVASEYADDLDLPRSLR